MHLIQSGAGLARLSLEFWHWKWYYAFSAKLGDEKLQQSLAREYRESIVARDRLTAAVALVVLRPVAIQRRLEDLAQNQFGKPASRFEDEVARIS